MLISESFAGKFLNAADLPQPRVLTMATVVSETIGEEKSSKPVLRFREEQRGLVLNKVNSLEIARYFGDDTGGWAGQQIELFSTITFFNGRQVPCVRVRRPPMQQPSQYQAAAPVQPYMQAPQPHGKAGPMQAPNIPFDA